MKNRGEPKLSVDQAVSAYAAKMRALPPASADAAAGAGARRLSAGEREEERLRMAAALLQQLCPDPRLCAHPVCRRGNQCRHVADLRRQQALAVSGGSRRTPGAIALRYAMWLTANQAAEAGGEEVDAPPGLAPLSGSRTPG